jgi:hypothetical protein
LSFVVVCRRQLVVPVICRCGGGGLSNVDVVPVVLVVNIQYRGKGEEKKRTWLETQVRNCVSSPPFVIIIILTITSHGAGHIIVVVLTWRAVPVRRVEMVVEGVTKRCYQMSRLVT